MTTNERRLALALRINVASDLVAQALVLIIAVVWVRSPWMIGVWLIRWVVLAAIAAALVTVRRGNPAAAVAVVVTGHAVGALGTVIIVPELVPIIMLAIFGDLHYAALLDRRHLRPLFAGCIAITGVVALLSLQRWTGLTALAPRWMVVAVVAGHGLGTGAVTARMAREAYTGLRARADELLGLRLRVRAAIHEEQAEIARALAAGPLADLDAITALLATAEADLGEADLGDARLAGGAARAANQAADQAQAALASLRRLSHGIFPDVLHQHGLARAVAGVAADAPAVSGVSMPDGRFDPATELAAYACVGEMAGRAAAAGAALGIDGTAGPHGLDLTVVNNGPGAGTRVAPLPARLVDRVGAIGGTVVLLPDGDGSLVLRVRLPLVGPDRHTVHPPPAGSTGPEAPGDADDPAGTGADRRMLHRFITASLVLSSAGLAMVAVVWLATGRRSVAAVGVVLLAVLALLTGARLAVAAGRYGTALALVCIETCAAGLSVTLLIPTFVPVTALITALPIVLSLPFLRRRALDFVGALQTAMLASVTVIALVTDGVVDPTPLPAVLTVPLVPLTATAVAVLVAVTVAATHAELEARTAQLTQGLRRLVEAADGERRRLERDLHDGAQQHFVAASLQLRALARLSATDPDRALAVAGQLRWQLADARRELVAVSDGGPPEAVARGDLAAAVRSTAALATLPIEVTVELGDPVPVPVAAAVWYCCREAVQNAHKHAGPQARVTVAVGRADGAVGFEICDTGRGFDPARTPRGRGLRSLEERVAAVGGRLSVSSAPGRGTTVTGTVPVGTVSGPTDRAAAPVQAIRTPGPSTPPGACRAS